MLKGATGYQLVKSIMSVVRSMKRGLVKSIISGPVKSIISTLLALAMDSLVTCTVLFAWLRVCIVLVLV